MPEPELEIDDIFPSFVDFGSSDDEEEDTTCSPSPKSSSPPTPSDSDEEDEDAKRAKAAAMGRRRSSQRPFMSLQQRRLSKLGYKNVGLQLDAFNLNQLQQKHTQAINIQNRQNNAISTHHTIAESPQTPSPTDTTWSPAKRKWHKALKLITVMKDPWAKFAIEKYPEEEVVRHRYNPLLKKWVKDSMKVKMETEPFNHGAMRSCYRMKRTNTTHHKASCNFVAKVYMEDVDRDVYFEDVKLQMDAKLWGEEYNRHHPPKQVDIFQMAIIEFVNRDDKPLYHLEHFIDGDYIKYNSNSGFVEESLRLTPQAFSHFTFERSGHKLIIVDVQGVGDLWTDPQIHTDDGTGYGSGNLGTRGFALFFHSHVCNNICKSLHLSKFDLSEKETTDMSKFIKAQKNATTMIRHAVDPVCSPSPTEKVDLTSFLARSRSRTLSRTSSGYSEEEEDVMPDGFTFRPQRRQRSSDMSVGSPVITTEQLRNLTAMRSRYMSESDDSGADTLSEEEERQRFRMMANQKHRPSCIVHEIKIRKESVVQTIGDSVLGQIHHDLAKYHELGRFAENDNEIDWDAALFHERLAADLGVMEAIHTMAKLNLGMQPDILVNCEVKPCDDSIEEGIKYMLLAANSGDRSSMLFMAKAYETGDNLGKNRTKSYAEAVHWYEKAYDAHDDDDDAGQFDGTMCTPLYIIKAKMAEMYLEGGFELDKDPSYAGELYNEAAEDAMNAMKGKMANKYYALAEEAYAQVEEEE